jgi:hypothetical protein
MRLRRKLVLGMTALLAAVPLAVVPSASAEVAAESCRPVDVTNPTGGAYISGQLCWTARGDGWYDMDWDVDVWDIDGDSAGAAAQIKYTTRFGVDSRAYRVDGEGAGARFLSSYSNGKGLYMRACLINGDSVHDCSDWK